MGRRKEDGLRYFPLDVNFFEDKRIRRLVSRFGADGPIFYIYILCSAYKVGYGFEYSDDFVEDAALDIGCSIEKIDLMLHYLLDKTLLDSTLFNTVKVLSSHGIQAQYQESKKGLKRDVEVDGDSWILKKSETEGFIKVRHSQGKSDINHDKSGINTDKSVINDTNKIKEKEIKLKETSVCAESEKSSSAPPVITLPLNDGTEYPVSQEQRQEWAGLYPAVDVIQQLRGMRGWLLANPSKRKTRRGILKFINGWLSAEQDRGGPSPAYNHRRRSAKYAPDGPGDVKGDIERMERYLEMQRKETEET